MRYSELLRVEINFLFFYYFENKNKNFFYSRNSSVYQKTSNELFRTIRDLGCEVSTPFFKCYFNNINR